MTAFVHGDTGRQGMRGGREVGFACVSDDDIEVFTREVLSLQLKGFQPQGGVSTLCIPFMNSYKVRYTQTLVR